MCANQFQCYVVSVFMSELPPSQDSVRGRVDNEAEKFISRFYQKNKVTKVTVPRSWLG